MYNHLLYLVYWGVNAVVIYAAGSLSGGAVELGVNKFVPFEAAVYGGFWMTFIVWTVWDFAIARGYKLGTGMTGMVYFLAANVLGMWAVTKLGVITGIRISDWLWLVGMALVCNFAQRLVRERLAGKVKPFV